MFQNKPIHCIANLQEHFICSQEAWEKKQKGEPVECEAEDTPASQNQQKELASYMQEFNVRLLHVRFFVQVK